MKLLVKTEMTIPEKDPPVESIKRDVFMVIRNHRQSLILKKQREIRKHKKIELKKRMQEELFEKERVKNEFMNKNMLTEEELWDVIAEDSKMYNCHEASTITQSPPSKLEVAKEFCRTLPQYERKSLFLNTFEQVTFAQ